MRTLCSPHCRNLRGGCSRPLNWCRRRRAWERVTTEAEAGAAEVVAAAATEEGAAEVAAAVDAVEEAAVDVAAVASF